MTVSAFDRYYAGVSDRNDRIEATRPHTYGGDKAITSLRAFQRYDRNATTDIFDLWGQRRWVTQKQSRIYAILRREAGSSSRLTMGMIALEAQVATSSVSRAILKFQGWGIFAVDVTRGRYGGITVALRMAGDGLADYARRAWERITRIADRARLMLRSRSETREEWLLVAEKEQELHTRTTQLLKDATLNEAWDAAERDGARLLASQRAADKAVAPLGRDRGFDPGRLTAENIVAEAREIDAEPEVDYVPSVPFEELVRIFSV
jgi:DNA-binding transcriptional regulator GbsR (MarR family)